MATSKKSLDDAIRTHYLDLVRDFLIAQGEEVLRTKPNVIALPCVDADGNDKFITLTFTVPQGSREDKEAYDGYAMAESYTLHLKEQAQKKAEPAAKKAAKVERDRKARTAKAQAKKEA